MNEDETQVTVKRRESKTYDLKKIRVKKKGGYRNEYVYD